MSDKLKKNSVGNNILAQFDQSWKMLSEAIDNAPDDLWIELKNDWCYAANVFHIIESVDFYSKEDKAGMEWGKRIGIDWSKDSKEEVNKKRQKISKDLNRNYLAEIKEKLEKIFKNTSDYVFLQADNFKYFSSNLERQIYSLRHAAHHIGELNKALREHGYKRIKWQ